MNRAAAVAVALLLTSQVASAQSGVGLGTSMPTGGVGVGAAPGGINFGLGRPDGGPRTVPASVAPLPTGADRRSVSIPGVGTVTADPGSVRALSRGLAARPGTSAQVVSLCRDAAATAAIPYGVERVDAAAAGPAREAGGVLSAPVEVRIVYRRRTGLEGRQATLTCRISGGRVVSLN